MGWSFGGIVTTLAASRSSRFAAVVVQAPGALNWERSEKLREALLRAAGTIRVPLQCVVAQNDATTASAREICSTAASGGARAVLKIYPPFTSGTERPGTPPGHALFGRAGVSVWEKDLLVFLAGALRR
jgi:dienelactone hydrolase